MARLDAIYASALFDLFMEMLAGLPDDAARKEMEGHYFAQVEILQGVFRDDECQRILLHPHITTAEKHTFLNNALSATINADLMGFLHLAITKNRESFILPALDGLIALIERYQRKTTAKVISANPLEDSQANTLRDMLAEKLNKHVELELSVDPSIIGGINIYVDGYFIDRTIKRKLKEMKDNVKVSTAIALQMR